MESPEPSLEYLDSKSSDYGSDFSLEEEGALIELLSRVTPRIDNPRLLRVANIEDDETPRKARLPCVTGVERRDHAQYQNLPALAIEEHGRSPTVEVDGNQSDQPIGIDLPHLCGRIR